MGGPESASADVLITPRALLATDTASAALTGNVLAVQFRDTGYAVTLRLDDTDQTVQISSDTRMRIGERVGLQILPDRLRWFPAHLDTL